MLNLSRCPVRRVTSAMPQSAKANLLYMGGYHPIAFLNVPGCLCVCKLPPLPQSD